MSGTQTGANEVNNNLANIQRSLADIAYYLSQLVVAPPLQSYTVALLPVTASIGAIAYATDGRKPGEGGGSGTGVPVWFDVSGDWFSFSSGAVVTV